MSVQSSVVRSTTPGRRKFSSFSRTRGPSPFSPFTLSGPLGRSSPSCTCLHIPRWNLTSLHLAQQSLRQVTWSKPQTGSWVVGQLQCAGLDKVSVYLRCSNRRVTAKGIDYVFFNYKLVLPIVPDGFSRNFQASVYFPLTSDIDKSQHSRFKPSCHGFKSRLSQFTLFCARSVIKVEPIQYLTWALQIQFAPLPHKAPASTYSKDLSS